MLFRRCADIPKAMRIVNMVLVLMVSFAVVGVYANPSQSPKQLELFADDPSMEVTSSTVEASEPQAEYASPQKAKLLSKVRSYLRSRGQQVNDLFELIETSLTGEEGEDFEGAFWITRFVKKVASPSTWVKFTRGLWNLRDARVNYVRATNMWAEQGLQSETAIEDAKNFPMIFAATEGTEVLLFPVFGAITAISPLPAEVKVPLTAFFAAGPAPGYDPVCLTVGTCYAFMPPLQRGVSAVRRGTFQITSFLYHAFRDSNSVRYAPLDGLGYLQHNFRSLSEYHMSIESDDSKVVLRLMKKHHQDLAAVLEFSRDYRQSAMGWSSYGQLLHVDILQQMTDDPSFRLVLNFIASHFGANTRRAVHEVVRRARSGRLSRLEDRFYVDGVRSDSSGRVMVNFKPHTIIVKEERRPVGSANPPVKLSPSRDVLRCIKVFR